MFLAKLTTLFIARAEKRIGVTFDYARHIALTDFGLLMRYNKIFGFLDPNRKVPPLAYHVARLRGAVVSDCGTCVEAEINLATLAKIDSRTIDAVLAQDYGALPDTVAAVARLADAVVGRREDEAEAREQILAAYGDAGLIELSYAMTGAALLPGIKRAMGYATVCDLDVLRKTVSKGL